MTTTRSRRMPVATSSNGNGNGQAAPNPARLGAGPTFAMLAIDRIRPGPHNPRRDLGDLDGLAASITAVGIVEPLIVEPEAGNASWPLLAGHRRLAAAKLAGLTEVPCIIQATAATPTRRLEVALVENLQRADLAPLDEADGYATLVGLGLSQRRIAERVGCSQSHVSKRLDLLALPKPIQARVAKGTLPLAAAAALVKLKDHPAKLKAAAGEDPSRIAYAVEQAEADIAWQAKRTELVTLAKDKGWPVVDEPNYHGAQRSFRTLAVWGYRDAELDIPVRAHAAEPCHAVMIPGDSNYRGIPPSATSVCTDPARHGPKGGSALKVKTPPKPAKAKVTDDQRAEAQRRLDRKAAGEARTAVLIPALAAHRAPSRSPALAMTLTALVHKAGWDTAAIACRLLGLPLDKDDRPHEFLYDYAARGNHELHRTALSVAAAGTEATLSGPYGRWAGEEVTAHYAWLATLGYQPTPFEVAELAAAIPKESNP